MTANGPSISEGTAMAAERDDLFNPVAIVPVVQSSWEGAVRRGWRGRQERSISQTATSIGASAVLMSATGAVAVGALAVGAVAVARLAVQRAVVGRLEIEELEVGRLRVRELEVLTESRVT
jgi:hypothetical protein